MTSFRFWISLIAVLLININLCFSRVSTFCKPDVCGVVMECRFGTLRKITKKNWKQMVRRSISKLDLRQEPKKQRDLVLNNVETCMKKIDAATKALAKYCSVFCHHTYECTHDQGEMGKEVEERTLRNQKREQQADDPLCSTAASSTVSRPIASSKELSQPTVDISEMQANLDVFLKNLRSLDKKIASDRLVRFLRQQGVKYIATDFDQTMITMHAGGALWPRHKGVYPQLSSHFTSFATEAYKTGMKIYVATFSDSRMPIKYAEKPKFLEKNRMTAEQCRAVKPAGAAFVEETIRRGLLKYKNQPFQVDGVVAFFPTYEGHTASQGKNLHLERVIKMIQETSGAKTAVQPQEIVLLDDDVKNIIAANAAGYRTIYVNHEGKTNDVGFSFDRLEAISS